MSSKRLTFGGRRCFGERERRRGPDIIKSGGVVRLNDDLWINGQVKVTTVISVIRCSTGGRLCNLIVEEKRRCRLEEDHFSTRCGLTHATASVLVE
ncbi:hypothetical protein PspLS_00275 [Pyricularia sp. CBS 133598]|nr:hypothetical protein PspLS_00275 [Pyricularia sp. CBS 133598]